MAFNIFLLNNILKNVVKQKDAQNVKSDKIRIERSASLTKFLYTLLAIDREYYVDGP